MRAEAFGSPKPGLVPTLPCPEPQAAPPPGSLRRRVGGGKGPRQDTMQPQDPHLRLLGGGLRRGALGEALSPPTCSKDVL